MKPIRAFTGRRPNTAGIQGLQSQAGNVSRTAQIQIIRVSKIFRICADRSSQDKLSGIRRVVIQQISIMEMENIASC